MTEKEALIHLGIFDDYDNDMIKDAVEQKVFDFKDFVFRNAPIYAVWQAKLNKLKLVFEAKNSLLMEKTTSPEPAYVELIIPNQNHPLDWLQAYQHERSRLFLQLQQVFDVKSIAQIIANLLRLEEHLKKQILSWFSEWEWVNEINHVLAKDKLDVGVLTWNLRQLIDEGAILYIEGNLVKIKDEVAFEEQLQKEFIRLQKLSF